MTLRPFVLLMGYHKPGTGQTPLEDDERAKDQASLIARSFEFRLNLLDAAASDLMVSDSTRRGK